MKRIRKIQSETIVKFVLLAFPAYWTLILPFIVLVVWGESIMHPDILAVALVSAAIIAAAVFLMKKHAWVSIPMVLLGIYIATRTDQFLEDLFRFFGAYLVLHYVICGVWVHKKNG